MTVTAQPDRPKPGAVAGDPFFTLSTGFARPNPAKRKEKQFTASETAFYVHREGTKVADRLLESAFYLESDEEIAAAIAISDCIRENESAANIYFSVNQTNKFGEHFNGFGSLALAAGSKFSPSYQAKYAARWERKIMKKLEDERVIDRSGELLCYDDGTLRHYPAGHRLRTLTMTTPLLDCDDERDYLIFKRALELFKKRKVWTDAVNAGWVKSELTSGKREIAHCFWHMHCLVVSRWLDFSSIANAWTDCYEIACEEYDVEFVLPSSIETNRLNIWITDVKTYADREGKPLKQVVNEISAYWSKSSALLDFPLEKLAHLEQLLEGERMIEPFGSFNNHKGKTIKPESQAAAGTPSIYNGTQLTAKKDKPRRRSALLRQGIALILAGRRGEWLKMLADRQEKHRAFRRRQLISLNPEAIFFTLDGKRFSSSDFVEPDKPDVSYKAASYNGVSFD